MDTSEHILLNAANMLLHSVNGCNTKEHIVGVETMLSPEKAYQLQVCLIPTRANEDKCKGVYNCIVTSNWLDAEGLLYSMQRLKQDSGIGTSTDINCTVQYMYVQGFKYALELRLTSSSPQLIQFEQYN